MICIILKYTFSNLNDLYNYLKSNPDVNYKIFREQASLNNESSFGGESLNVAIAAAILMYDGYVGGVTSGS